MRTFQQVSALRSFVRAAREDGKIVGFVPTMGALHEGHQALIRRASAECDVVIVSIFVNPIQFIPGEDFDKYPRDLNNDSNLARAAGAVAIFAPTAQEMYPDGFQTIVDVPALAKRWEGSIRPGHFRGVATVCAKLFSIVQPHRAYFGQKDFQQLKVIERMTADLSLPLIIVSVPTVRESDGLAMSSRNSYLSDEERKEALCLSLALKQAEQLYTGGERTAEKIREAIAAIIAETPSARLDYIAIVNPDTLEPIEELIGKAVVLLAVRIGQTRLIDNTLLG